MNGAPRPTGERIWSVYLVAVVAVVLCTPAGGDAAYRPGWHLAVHAAVGAAVFAVRWVAVHCSHDAARVLRGALAVVGLPVVFSAMGWLLPALHPEPYEYLWLAVDRALFGADVARLVDGALPRFGVELLQLDYASFYALCMASALLAGWHSGGRAFDRAVVLLVGGFLASYLGYLLVPTLAPKLVLAHPADVEGLWLTAPVRACIDGAEANRWDCFPSGHTMMTVTSLIILWRWARPAFRVLLLPGLLLIASTVLLRYHWVADVAAGAACAWPCVWLCDRLVDCDGWPPAPAGQGRAVGQQSRK